MAPLVGLNLIPISLQVAQLSGDIANHLLQFTQFEVSWFTFMSDNDDYHLNLAWTAQWLTSWDWGKYNHCFEIEVNIIIVLMILM
jgi:hypothetical protein